MNAETNILLETWDSIIGKARLYAKDKVKDRNYLEAGFNFNYYVEEYLKENYKVPERKHGNRR
jgi:hypothetical protein